MYVQSNGCALIMISNGWDGFCFNVSVRCVLVITKNKLLLLWCRASLFCLVTCQLQAIYPIGLMKQAPVIVNSKWEWVCFTYLWAQSSSCTVPPPHRVFCLTACKVSRTQSGWCCDTSQSQSSSLVRPSPRSTTWQTSPGHRQTWGPGLWGSPVGEQSPLIKCKCKWGLNHIEVDCWRKVRMSSKSNVNFPNITMVIKHMLPQPLLTTLQTTKLRFLKHNKSS